MGGYAFYVWGSYAAVAAGVALEVWLLRQRRQRAISELAQSARSQSTQ